MASLVSDAFQFSTPLVKRRFNRHSRQWSSCKLCPLHKFANCHVLGSGVLPCDVLFIGEAPGETEDTLGKPFVGRAGKVLDAILIDVLSRLKKPFSFAITNVVACKPFPKGAEIAKPEEEHIEACRPRLVEFIKLADPLLIVALGKVAEQNMPSADDGLDPDLQIINVWHPSYIARQGGVGSLEYTKTVLSLTKLFKVALG